MDMATFRLPDGAINPASDVPEWGFNGGMTNVSGALGLANLETVDELIESHQYNAKQILGGPDTIGSSCWCLTLLHSDRASLQQHLQQSGFQAQPLHVRNDNYSVFGPPQRHLPGVDEFDSRNLAVPCGWWLTKEDRNRLIAALNYVRG
jgi:dTDP-4-amino-4,6-dideoxygalactose transaminase